MSGARDGIQIVVDPAGGWCEPATGVCHMDTADEVPSAEADNEDAAGDAPAATER
ncbi:hypothetical protein [Spongiactinospora rosea]|uniref:hypothetical protein n=1 Tax=Spongiactinospora rosea TaxID=2248750 RepID=UPI001313E674|nr:hypothetical protein [Spongiactinospora rosea]